MATSAQTGGCKGTRKQPTRKPPDPQPPATRRWSKRASWYNSTRRSDKRAKPAKPKRFLDDVGLAPSDVLALAHAVYRCTEWRSAKAAAISMTSASWEVVYDICQDVDAFTEFRSAHPGFEVSTADEAAASEIFRWATDRVRIAGDDSTYRRDLATAVEAEEVSGNSFALVCSAAAAFRQVRDRHVSKAHIGAIGARQTFSLTLKKITPVNPKKKRFGISYRLGFRDSEGNDVVWFSSREPRALGIALDQPCAIKATVRRHDEHAGSLQTIVSRGKLVAA
jgi:hypothetical protein